MHPAPMDLAKQPHPGDVAQRNLLVPEQSGTLDPPPSGLWRVSNPCVQ